jgi:hypothetical protein
MWGLVALMIILPIFGLAIVKAAIGLYVGLHAPAVPKVIIFDKASRGYGRFGRLFGAFKPQPFHLIDAPWWDKNAHPKRTPEIRRGQRVADLLRPRCPRCQVGPGEGCKPLPGVLVAEVDPKWHTLCHFERMKTAIKNGTARRREVIAQWGPNLPKGIKL